MHAYKLYCIPVQTCMRMRTGESTCIKPHANINCTKLNTRVPFVLVKMEPSKKFNWKVAEQLMELDDMSKEEVQRLIDIELAELERRRQRRAQRRSRRRGGKE